MKFFFPLSLILAAVLAVLGEEPHSGISYMIVPAKDVTPALIALCAQTSTNTLRHSVSGKDRVILKIARYKLKADPMPSPLPNDEPMTAKQLEGNAKLAKYRHAHKTTPDALRKYKQYSYEQILVELKKPEWVFPWPPGTNVVGIGEAIP